jgi:hypothetical protein
MIIVLTICAGGLFAVQSGSSDPKSFALMWFIFACLAFSVLLIIGGASLQIALAFCSIGN